MGLSNLSHFRSIVVDILNTVKLSSFWLAMAWEDIVTTYHRSFLGVIWITLTFLAFLAIKVIVFSQLIGASAENNYFTAYVSIGFLVYMLISSVLSESTSVFIQFEGWIKNDNLPILGFPIISCLRCLFNFMFHFIAAAGVVGFVGAYSLNYLWTLVPALLLLFWTSYATLLFFGMLSLRYRDIGQVILTFVRVSIFITPVIWLPAQLGSLMEILWWNPLYHYIEIIRAPIIDNSIPSESWVFCLVFSGFLSLLAFGFYARSRNEVINWL